MEQNPTAAFDNRLPHLSAKYPWLVAQNLDGTGDQSFYTIHNQQCHYHCRIPNLLGRRIRGCFYGWIILSNKNSLSVWNPVTSDIINLPPLMLNNSESIHECCLSSAPDDPNSVLLLTITKKSTFLLCQLGFNRKWSRMEYRRQVVKAISYYEVLKCLTCYNGKVYALCDDNIIQIDIIVQDDGKILVELLQFASVPPGVYIRFPKSVNSGTELFFIKADFNEVTRKILSIVYLFKWDMSSMRWEDMVNIKDAVFYVDLAHDYSVYYNRVIVPEFGGYIHIRDETGKVMYSYDVEDGTISISSVAYPTSHVSMWECSLEGDYDDSEVTQVCKKEEVEEDKIVVRSVVDDEAESHLLNLPLHLLKTIIDHCIGVEYLSFHATWKHCHLAAPSINWSNKTALSRLHKYSLVTPWLMVAEKHRSIVSFTDPIAGGKYFMRRLQDSNSHDRLLCSRFGWLLLCDKDSKMVFFNPFTSDTHELPGIPHLSCRHIDSLSFSAPPTFPDCMVVGFARSCLYINVVAQKQPWRRIIFMFFDEVDHLKFRFPTFHGRDLYVLCDNNQVWAIENIGGVDGYVCTKVTNARSCVGEYYLVKWGQQLVIVGVVGEYVEVYKLNNHNKDWLKIKSIGMYTIYICGETCLCIEAKTKVLENKIFFPRLYSKNGKIVFYSLETCKYQIFNGKNIEETGGFGIKQTYNHAWIEPAWS